MFKWKVAVVIAVVLLLGITGVALASGKVATPGSSDNTAVSGTGGPGTPGLDTGAGAAAGQYAPAGDEDSAVENQYADDDSTEVNDDADDQDEHATEMDDDDADEVHGSMDDDDYTAPPATAPASGGGYHQESGDDDHMGSGSVTGTTVTGTNSPGSGSQGSSSKRHMGDD